MARPAQLLPAPSLRFIPIWRRNLRVWRKLMVPSVLGNFGEPLLYLFVFGYGFGRLVGEVERMPYMDFLASGIVCSSIMLTSSFEALYSAFTRMHEQQTWTNMLNAPLNVDDIVLGEIAFAATKGMFSGVAILVVASLAGFVAGPAALWVLPMMLLIGFCFGSLAMVVTAIAPGYDFFLYYFTLILTPMLLLSGVFFPLSELPPVVAGIAHLLPLANAVAIVRPLMTGTAPTDVVLHLSVVIAYGVVAWIFATHRLRRRLAS
ncbi:ABC transporter permease [Halofilum ochraceum]|uniref:ABC transporter permease n=1 Tax=Halofilum ochraceum TaxID=1611323 RepID=UPI000832E91B|nr:ABC transporter permease [Halofilum ochraceum]